VTEGESETGAGRSHVLECCSCQFTLACCVAAYVTPTPGALQGWTECACASGRAGGQTYVADEQDRGCIVCASAGVTTGAARRQRWGREGGAVCEEHCTCDFKRYGIGLQRLRLLLLLLLLLLVVVLLLRRLLLWLLFTKSPRVHEDCSGQRLHVELHLGRPSRQCDAPGALPDA
jgi:hypothetical protein